MKKLWKITIICFLIIGITACKENTKETDTSRGDDKVVSLSLKEDTLTSKWAVFIIKNNSDEVYIYGPEYTIEVQNSGEWEEIKLDEPLSWNAVVYTLDANESKEININWGYSYGELSSGKYRLVKTTFKEEDRPMDDTQRIYLYAEFEITDNK